MSSYPKSLPEMQGEWFNKVTENSMPTKEFMPMRGVLRPRHNVILNKMRSSEYWANRAEEVRVLSEQMKYPDARRIMDQIAEDYERIGSLIEGSCCWFKFAIQLDGVGG